LKEERETQSRYTPHGKEKQLPGAYQHFAAKLSPEPNQSRVDMLAATVEIKESI
jgi:hypothetical protein